MSKNISITHIDEQPTKEQIGETKKRELAHEKLFSEFGIDPEKLYDGTVLKQIPQDWIPQIIEKNIQSISPEFEISEFQHFTNNKIFLLIFKDVESTVSFDTKFNKNMFSTINSFIENQKANPKNYHRNIIFTQNVEGTKMSISY